MTREGLTWSVCVVGLGTAVRIVLRIEFECLLVIRTSGGFSSICVRRIARVYMYSNSMPWLAHKGLCTFFYFHILTAVQHCTHVYTQKDFWYIGIMGELLPSDSWKDLIQCDMPFKFALRVSHFVRKSTWQVHSWTILFLLDHKSTIPKS